MNFIKLSGIFGIIAVILSLSGVFISASLCDLGCGSDLAQYYSSRWNSDGSFNWRTNALSDLGVSDVANIFNYSLIISGILNFIFSIGLFRYYNKNIVLVIGSILLIIGGASLSFVGIFTEADGILHLYSAIGFFTIAPLSFIIFGIYFIQIDLKNKGYFSIILGAASLLVISAFFNSWHQYINVGFAVPEIIEAILISLWISWMGYDLYNHSE